MNDSREPLRDRLREALTRIYGTPLTEEIYPQFLERLTTPVPRSVPTTEFFSEKSITLITYGDSLNREGESPLATLGVFLADRLSQGIDSVHILPFYPYSSDDGFSVIDYYAVDSALGDWSDVRHLGGHFRLMFDAVVNHMSVQSDWFKRFLAGEPDYRNLFSVASPQMDLRSVTRPRTSPLLTLFSSATGKEVHVWTTFSDDQADLNYRDPHTLLRILDVLRFYVQQGAGVLRLDAIAYLWKQAGTCCIHLAETHAVIQLMRVMLDAVAPDVILITETNVPHSENISYFGDGFNEAQLVYNFALPPLLLHALVAGQAGKLADWINTLSTPSPRTTFFNFTASHDGIGVRPVEGILDSSEIDSLITAVQKRGGYISYKTNPDRTSSPYELNIAFVDATADPALPLDLRIESFLLSQAVMLTLAGVPAIYVHSIMGSHSDQEAVLHTGINRRINRAKLKLSLLEQELADPDSFRSRIFSRYLKMIQARRSCPAFHPLGRQYAAVSNSGAVLALVRTAPYTAVQVLALFNLTADPQPVVLETIFSSLGVDASRIVGWQDLLADEVIINPPGTLRVGPYGFCWLELHIVNS